MSCLNERVFKKVNTMKLATQSRSLNEILQLLKHEQNSSSRTSNSLSSGFASQALCLWSWLLLGFMIHRDISGLSRTRSCDLRWIPKLGMHHPSIRKNNTEEESTRHELCDRSCCLLSYNTFIIRRRVLPRPRTTRHKNGLHLHLRPGVVPHISSTSLQHLFNISSTSQRAPINRILHLTLRFP